jgi:hypothetical protein
MPFIVHGLAGDDTLGLWQNGGVDFAAPGGQEALILAAHLPADFQAAQAELREQARRLRRLQDAARQEIQIPAEAISFGLFSGDDQSWQQEAEAFLQRAVQVLNPRMQVETRQPDGLVAVTRVSLGGDLSTAWSAGRTPGQRELHQQNLQLALQSRAAWLMLAGHITRAATDLSTRLALPGGFITALPAAWKHFKAIMEQAKRL